jgi:DNA-binding transcriptional regulator WhiA
MGAAHCMIETRHGNASIENQTKINTNNKKRACTSVLKHEILRHRQSDRFERTFLTRLMNPILSLASLAHS